MSKETKLPTEEELWGMVQEFSRQAADLEKKLRDVSEGAHREGTGWIKFYQSQFSEIVSLKAQITRLESRVRELQGGS